ncbi:MAG: hypothetical protein EBV32_05595 [Proteobacteria bacterium]|uniref:Uncharacterized protein n=1 Tax=Candidatus Fonsibacter lacus TaxID=2576439 RepID=A0A964V0W0_9PROT|nr:hypothetical protein [Candidatus Fonsibacter lacus]NCU72476.1 hypothetical protein [Candidatus Fonsibacter lacus]
MKNILDKINRADEIQANLELDKTELGKHEVELSLVDDLNKLKNQFISSWKSHTSKRDAWGAESTKILQLIAQHETKGQQLKKETEGYDKQLLEISSRLTKLRNQADQLGLTLPRELELLDGISLTAWGNKLVDTREIVDEFNQKLK